MKSSKVPLVFISAEVTRRCNLNCPHCTIKNTTKKELSKSDFFNFLEQNQDKFQDITITGGEPTLRADLPNIIRKVHSYKKYVCLLTNASTPLERIIKANPDAVKISLDFPDERHDAWRGKPGLFKHVTEEVIPALKNRMPVMIVCTITKKNFSDMDKMVALAEKLGVKIVFQRYIPKTKGNNDELMLTPVQMQEMFAFIKERFNPDKVSYYGGFGHIISGEPSFCGAGLVKVHITSEGKITPCMFLLDKSYGTIKKEFDKTRTKIISMRKIYEESVKQTCGQCEKYPKTCAGDCMAIAFALNNPKGQCKNG